MRSADVRRLTLGVVAMALAAAGMPGCGTEPSDANSVVYRLAAADSATTGGLQCFASSTQYSGGAPIRSGNCDVTLRSLEAWFDSSGPNPALVVGAKVRLYDGDTTTWRVAIPATIQNYAIQYDFGPVTGPLTDEQVFVLPWTGTLVDGVLTLRMPNYTNSGQPDRTEYARATPTVFVLTATGRPPRPSALARRYTAISIAALPMDYCDDDPADVPNRCLHRSFTLAASGTSWEASYDELVHRQDTLVGSVSWTVSNLTLAHPTAFVRVSSPGAWTIYNPSPFEAQGTLVGDILTLFADNRTLDGAVTLSPIVARAE